MSIGSDRQRLAAAAAQQAQSTDRPCAARGTASTCWRAGLPVPSCHAACACAATVDSRKRAQHECKRAPAHPAAGGSQLKPGGPCAAQLALLRDPAACWSPACGLQALHGGGTARPPAVAAQAGAAGGAARVGVCRAAESPGHALNGCTWRWRGARRHHVGEGADRARIWAPASPPHPASSAAISSPSSRASPRPPPPPSILELWGSSSSDAERPEPRSSGRAGPGAGRAAHPAPAGPPGGPGGMQRRADGQRGAGGHWGREAARHPPGQQRGGPAAAQDHLRQP